MGAQGRAPMDSFSNWWHTPRCTVGSLRKFRWALSPLGLLLLCRIRKIYKWVIIKISHNKNNSFYEKIISHFLPLAEALLNKMFNCVAANIREREAHDLMRVFRFPKDDMHQMEKQHRGESSWCTYNGRPEALARGERTSGIARWAYPLCWSDRHASSC